MKVHIYRLFFHDRETIFTSTFLAVFSYELISIFLIIISLKLTVFFFQHFQFFSIIIRLKTVFMIKLGHRGLLCVE